MHRNDEPGHTEAELVDEIARFEDDAKALGAEIDSWEQQDREEDARDEAIFRKFRVVEIGLGVGLLVVAWVCQGC
jgi:hypothetical protein